VAFTITEEVSSSSGTDASSYTTASVSVTAGDVIFLIVTNGSTAGAASTVLNIGGTLGSDYTWTMPTGATVLMNVSGRGRSTIYWAHAPADNSGTITINFDVTQASCHWTVATVTGADTTNPVVQVKTAQESTADPFITFNSAVASDSMVLAAFHANSTTAATAGTGMTLLDAGTSQSSPALRQAVEYDLTTPSDTAGFTHSGSTNKAIVGVEIRPPSGGGASHVASGTVAATSASTGTALARFVAAGVTAAVTTVTGTPVAVHPITGTNTAQSATTGTAAARLTSAGTGAATSTTTGALSARLAATGVAASTSATTGDAGLIENTEQFPASGTVTATTTVNGAATKLTPATGTVAATSSASGDAGIETADDFSSSGTVTAASSTTGTVTALRPTAGTAASTTTITGAATALLPSSGTVLVTGDTTGAVTGLYPAAGTVEAVSTATGAATNPDAYIDYQIVSAVEHTRSGTANAGTWTFTATAQQRTVTISEEPQR
jgi:hypothetical protein